MLNLKTEYTIPIGEAAQQLGITIGTVRKHVQLAKAKGITLGTLAAAPNGGWRRYFTESDMAYLRTVSTGKSGWTLGKRRKVADDGS